MTIRLHDWQRIYKSGATYLGRTLWAYVDRRGKPLCPFDNDGDGNCGRRYCPHCGEGR